MLMRGQFMRTRLGVHPSACSKRIVLAGKSCCSAGPSAQQTAGY
jgi:hypothetical protein